MYSFLKHFAACWKEQYFQRSRKQKMNDNCSESKIGQFYNEKSVFITGATGFMGKVNGLPELDLKSKIPNCRCW